MGYQTELNAILLRGWTEWDGTGGEPIPGKNTFVSGRMGSILVNSDGVGVYGKTLGDLYNVDMGEVFIDGVDSIQGIQNLAVLSQTDKREAATMLERYLERERTYKSTPVKKTVVSNQNTENGDVKKNYTNIKVSDTLTSALEDYTIKGRPNNTDVSYPSRDEKLNFLKVASFGLLNKKGSSFDIKASGSIKDRRVTLLINNEDSTSGRNSITLRLSYLTRTNWCQLVVEQGGFDKYQGYFLKESITEVLNLALHVVRSEKGEFFSSEDDRVDVYSILDGISESIFDTDDKFDLNFWRSSLHLYKKLGVDYGELKNALHVHGGIGEVQDIDKMHWVTACVELGDSPRDGKTYLQVESSISSSPILPEGLYDGTVEMFKDIVINQFKYAKNKPREVLDDSVIKEHMSETSELWEFLDRVKGGSSYVPSRQLYNYLADTLDVMRKDDIKVIDQQWKLRLSELRSDNEFDKLHVNNGGVVNSGDDGFYMDFASWVLAQGEDLYTKFKKIGSDAVIRYIKENNLEESEYMFECMSYAFHGYNID